MGVQRTSSVGSTSSALASLRMLAGYSLPPFSAREIVFFETPACLARSSNVSTRFLLNSLSTSTFTSIGSYIASLLADVQPGIKFTTNQVASWEKVGKIPVRYKKGFRASRQAKVSEAMAH